MWLHLLAFLKVKFSHRNSKKSWWTFFQKKSYGNFCIKEVETVFKRIIFIPNVMIKDPLSLSYWPLLGVFLEAMQLRAGTHKTSTFKITLPSYSVWKIQVEYLASAALSKLFSPCMEAQTTVQCLELELTYVSDPWNLNTDTTRNMW